MLVPHFLKTIFRSGLTIIINILYNSLSVSQAKNQIIKSVYQGALLPLPKLEINDTKSCLEKGLIACRRFDYTLINI